MATGDTTNENNELKRVVQQITTSGTTSDKEGRRKRTSVSGMVLGFKMKQKINLIPESFYIS